MSAISAIMAGVRGLPLFLGVWVVFGGALGAAPPSGPRFLVDYSPRINLAACAGFEEVILDPFAEIEGADPEAGGPKLLAYLSLVEIAADAPYRAEAEKQGLVVEGASNAEWNSCFADVPNPRWESFVVERLAAPAAAKGFDGFFLDTADSVARLPGADKPEQLKASRNRLASLVTELRRRWPERRIIINRGFELIEQLPDGTLDGVMVESLYQTCVSPPGKALAGSPEARAVRTFTAVGEADTHRLEAKLARCRKRGLAAYVIDYVDPAQPELAAATARRIEALGASPLITTPDLDGLVLAPAAPVPRMILVLYGSDPELSAAPRTWPSDTEVARQLQPALEWMGYELRFHRATDAGLPEAPPDRFAGILVESGLVLTAAREHRYADWLLKQTTKGLKVLFAGSFPFRDPGAQGKLLDGLGIRHAPGLVAVPESIRISRKNDALLDHEREVRPRRLGFIGAVAPPGAVSHLRLACEDRRGHTRYFDPVFTADWGGALLDPYWTFQPSANDSFSYVDVFGFLDLVFPAGRFPAPDATTRNGLRLLWAHIDGDGFVTRSNIKRDALCAEIIRDRILTRYPIPATVSVIEAEIRSLQTTQDPASEPRHTALAREIFALPHIEAASHSYSHPFVWSPRDVKPHTDYHHGSLLLRREHSLGTVDPRREVAGSIEYIERELLPPGKKVKLMLWSGNCRPFPEAIRQTRSLGIENMNGGFTVHSKRHPQLAAIAPRVTWWDDQLQIYAANQNDFVYTHDWSTPVHGGFEQVVDSFLRLDSPRRLKPVNIYYHFYSGVDQGALTALERVHDWAAGRPLHAVTASEAASLTRGAVFAEVRQTGPRRWLVSGHGTLTTFRLPQALGYPDLAASTNVIGFNDHGAERYVHTNGECHAEIVLVPEPPRHLYLRSSEAAVFFDVLGPGHCRFSTRSWRPSALLFGGARPASAWTLTIREEGRPPAVRSLTAGPDGRLAFTVPPQAEVALAPAASTAAR